MPTVPSTVTPKTILAITKITKEFHKVTDSGDSHITTHIR